MHNLVSDDVSKIISIAIKFRETGDLNELNIELNSISTDKIKRSVIRDILCGIWSGFPICCVIAFSCHGWKGYDETKYFHTISKYKPYVAQYVQCKHCIDSDNYISDIRKGSFKFDESNHKWLFVEHRIRVISLGNISIEFDERDPQLYISN